MSRPDGGPAFPIPDGLTHGCPAGMSLRDYFAAKAMQGYIVTGPADYSSASELAACAYDIADAMLAERAK